ncbi:MAG TPA: NAD(P)/FAD-dependent oxidoreductase [Vicinamibacterales bacterium]|jgi:geranylgeranyl reductase family protein
MQRDVIVVGGGPAGLYAAWRMASAGYSVLVCEEHQEIGLPVHCTGVLSAATFEEFSAPRDAILNPLDAVRFVSPGGLQVRYTPPRAEAVVIDRGRFDQRLAAQARSAGVEFRFGTRITALDCGDRGVTARGEGLEERARLAMVATGASYMLQRRFGLGLPRAYLHTAQRELPAAAAGDVELHFGSAVAPGGFGWAVPIQRAEGAFVRVGVMTRRDPVRCFDEMMKRVGAWQPSLHAEPPRVKVLPLRTIAQTYSDRLLAIGDAAGLVKPTTGGGIYYSLVSAALAADVAEEALLRDDLRSVALRPYEMRWRRRLAAEFQAQWLLRRIAEQMSDRQIDALFDLALTDGVMPIVQRTAAFNHHRPLISALLRHAPARRIFWPARA